MNKWIISIVVSICVSVYSLAEDNEADNKEKDPAGNPPSSTSTNSAKLKSTSPAGILSEEDEAKLQKSYTDEKTKTAYAFDSGCGLPKLTEKEKAKYKKSGEVPYKIFADLYEVKQTSKGPKSERILQGTAYIYMKDSDGKTILTKSVSMKKMCLT